MLKKLWTMLHVLDGDLQTRAKTLFKSKQKTIKTAPELFIGNTFEWLGKKYRVQSLALAHASSGAAMAQFTAKACNGTGTVEVSKSELISALDSASCDVADWNINHCGEKNSSKRCDKCKAACLWEMHLKVSSWRFVAHLAFVLDLHETMAGVSEAFQAVIIMIGRLASKVDEEISEIRHLAASLGHLEKKFEAYTEGAGGLWKTDVLQLVDRDGDRSAHEQDRKQICDNLAGAFAQWYKTALDDPCVKLMSVFDRQTWDFGPDDRDKLEAYGINEITRLMDNYSQFFTGADNAMCLKQWLQLKKTIVREKALRSLPFEKLWPHILLHYTEFNVINWLVAIVVLLPVDTSGCERLFSHMNLLMSRTQASMSHETLRHMLIWYECNCVLPPDEWDLVLRKTVQRWLKADTTKSGKRKFRRDSRQQTLVQAVEACAAELVLPEHSHASYQDLVLAKSFE